MIKRSQVLKGYLDKGCAIMSTDAGSNKDSKLRSTKVLNLCIGVDKGGPLRMGLARPIC